MTGPDPKTSNDWTTPDRVRATPFEACTIGDERITFDLPPMAFVAASL